MSIQPTVVIGRVWVTLLRTNHDHRLLHDDVRVTVLSAIGDCHESTLTFCGSELDDLIEALLVAQKRALIQ